MKKANAIAISIICGFFLFSCTSFLIKKDISLVKEYEKADYTLKEDAGEEERLIRKGTKVKLFILTGDNFIKVYCYPANINFVKAERILILYMFEDEFKKSRFDQSVFDDLLFKKVAVNK